MIISRTPFRISFFGGGTDYPAWYRQHGGEVLAAAIDKYCYLTCRYLPPFFDHRYRIVYSRIENARRVDEIVHPAVRAVLQFRAVERGLEIHHDGDLPARSGMGSSSSFTVGLLHALYGLEGLMPSKRQLALESIHIEQELIGETVGSQDQVSAAYGGFNHIVFAPGGDISVRPVTVSAQRIAQLEQHLMLFFTGINRTAASVASSYVSDLDRKRRQLRIMSDLVREAIDCLTAGGSLVPFGELLHEAWLAKRSLGSAVSNPEVDAFYDRARTAGALGGKLTGAGGGGFLLLFAPPDRHESIRDELSELIHVPFRIEHSGSQIIFLDHEQDYAAEESAREQQDLSPFRELVAP
jgi:D-glycero-alpha-D-manno-heptose-7-phosphate kinase